MHIDIIQRRLYILERFNQRKVKQQIKGLLFLIITEIE